MDRERRSRRQVQPKTAEQIAQENLFYSGLFGEDALGEEEEVDQE